MLEDTKARLTDWGQWVRSGGSMTGYSAVNLMAPSGGCDVPDDEALMVDRAVAALKKREPDLGKALVNYYVRRWNYAVLGLELRVNREKARVMVMTGEAWVDSRLFPG